MIPKKRYWFVFNENDCQLEYYHNEKEFIDKKPPIEAVNVSRSAVLLDVNEENQFIIL